MFVVSGFLQSARPERSGHVRQVMLLSSFALRQGLGTANLGDRPRGLFPRGYKSSPRLAARDGMEQGPYEFRSYAIGAKRVRRRTDQSATAFPRFTVLNQFFSGSASARLAVRLLQVFAGNRRVATQFGRWNGRSRRNSTKR